MSEKQDFLGRWIRRYISNQEKYWGWSILIAFVIMGVSVHLALRLRLNSDMESLLPKSAPSVQALQILKPKSGGSNDFRILLEGGSLQARLQAAEALTEFLRRQKTPQGEDFVQSIRYTTPKDFFESHKYQFIPIESLEALHERVREERSKYKDITDPFGFEEESNPKPSSAEPKSEEERKADVEAAKDLLKRLDEMRPYYLTEDGKVLVIRMIPNATGYGISENKVLLKELQGHLSQFSFADFDPAIRWSIYGSIPRSIERYESILNDLQFGGWGILVIMILVSLYFRSIGANFVLIPPLVLGLLAGSALVWSVEGALNSIAVFLILVIFGMGIEFGIHLFARYLQERKARGVRESVFETWNTTGRATLTSSTALLAGYALLTFSSFQGFAQFGRVAILLVTFTAIGFLVFMPACLFTLEKFRKHRPWPESLATLVSNSRYLRSSSSFNGLGRPLRLLSFALGIGGLIVCLLYVRFDYNFEEVSDRPATAHEIAMHEIFSERLKPSAVAAFPSRKEAADFMDYFDEHKAEYPDIALMSGLSTFFPLDQKERIEKLKEISDDLEFSWVKKLEDEDIRRALTEIKKTAYDLEVYELSEVPPEVRDPFIASDDSGDFLVYIFDIGGRTDGRKAIQFSDAVSDFLMKVPQKPVVSGNEIIFADIVRRVIGEGPWLVLGMLFLVFLICWMDFKTLSGALLTLSPVLFGFVLTGMCLVLFKTQINFYNMVALASLGSMVVDNSIHLYHRYLEYQDGQHRFPVREASLSVSPTVITCTLTSISGYGGMVFADHLGIASLGRVAVIGLTCCLIAAVVFFPPWLGLSSKRR